MGELLSALGALAGGMAPGIERGRAIRRERREREAEVKREEVSRGQQIADKLRMMAAQKRMGLEGQKAMELFRADVREKEKQRSIQAAFGMFGIAPPGVPTAGPGEAPAPGEAPTAEPGQLEPDLLLMYKATVAEGKSPVAVIHEQASRNLKRQQAKQQAAAQAEQAAARVELPRVPAWGGPRPEEVPFPPATLFPPPEIDVAREQVEEWEERTGKTIEELWADPEFRERAAAGGPRQVFESLRAGARREPSPRRVAQLMEYTRRTGQPWRRRPPKKLRKEAAKSLLAMREWRGKRRKRVAKREERRVAEAKLAEQEGAMMRAIFAGETPERAAAAFMPKALDYFTRVRNVEQFFKGMPWGRVRFHTANPQIMQSLAAKFGLRAAEIGIIASGQFVKEPTEEERAEIERAKAGG